MSSGTEGRHIRSVGFVAAAASVAVVLIGLSVLLGYALQIPALKTGGSAALVAMNPVTALGFVLAGAALWFSRTEEPQNRAHVHAARLCATLVVLIGLLKVCEYLYDWNTGFDRLLFEEQLGAVGALHPNRIAPNTALNFLIAGAALLLLDVRDRRYRVAPLLTVSVMLIAVLALIGYAYGTRALYGVASYIAMARNTAVAFLILSVGMLCARPGRHPVALVISDGPGGVLARRLLIPALVVPLIFGWLELRGQGADLYDAAGGIALLVTATVAVIATLIWWSARSLDSSDAERRRAERTTEKARELAEAASRAKSDFLAKMSHELRTPLNSIIGFSEVLEDQAFGPLNEKQRRYVSNVLSSGRQLLDLINDILDLSKVEAGRMELFPAEFDVAVALDECRRTVEPLADRKKLALEFAPGPPLPHLRADRARVKQVVLNLLSNAIKFTPDGGRVRLSARRVPDPAGDAGPGWIEIAVADTGIGIGPDDQARIFAEFEQVDSSYARGQQGTGLGLAVSRKLVELHGGHIRVESEPGQGSVFRVVLPLGAAAPVAAAPHGALAGAAGTGGARPLVLIVDDDSKSADLLAHHLEAAGYRIARAAEPEEAVRLAKELTPQLITLDILLRGRDGLVVLAQLKTLAETKEIPVMVVSVTEEQELGFSLGAADWLVKPVNGETLVAAVRRLVAGGSPQRLPSARVVDDEPAPAS